MNWIHKPKRNRKHQPYGNRYGVRRLYDDPPLSIYGVCKKIPRREAREEIKRELTDLKH